jgi:NADH-quinone oxidoreductase subunit M
VTRHLLSIIAIGPLVGALTLLLVRGDRGGLLRAIASVTTGLVLAASSRLWFAFEVRGAEWQFTERLDALPSIGASYALGIDGLSLLLILLTTFLTFIAVLASWTSVTTRATGTSGGKEHYIAVLVLEAGMLGVYMALDLLLFCLCWVLAAASMCLLIGTVGGRMRVALRVCAIAIVPGFLILLGVLALHVQGRALIGAATFDLRTFQHLSLPPAVQRWVFLTFFVGFGAGLLGVFRWWLAAAAGGRGVAAPLLLAAVFLKMGTYGFLRLSLPLLPDASRAFATAMVAVSVIGIIFGAVAAFAQTNWTRVLAFASLSHICLVMLGAFALTPDGLTGSAVHQINHGISIAALFLVAGLVAERGQAADLSEYGGLLNAVPRIAALWLLMTLSLVGVPKLNGFVGTSLIVEGIWSVNRVGSIVAVTGMVLSGVALLWLFSRTMLGELRSPAGGALKDLRLREAAVFVPLVLLAVWIGLRPGPLLATVETSVARIVLRVSPEFASEVADCLTQPVPPPADGLLPGMVLAAPCADGAGSPTSPQQDQGHKR